MVYVHYKQVIAMLEEASAASNAVEGGPAPVRVGSGPSCSNLLLDGATPGPRRWLKQVDNLVTHVSDVGARHRAAGS